MTEDTLSLEPKDYKSVIVVCGTRGYEDRAVFHHFMLDFLEEVDKPALFVSGDAKSGADHLCVLWCKKFGHPCLRVPAEWNPDPNSDYVDMAAGYKRNAKMGEMATHVLAFFDGSSKGTANMIEIAEKRKLHLKIIVIPRVKSNR